MDDLEIEELTFSGDLCNRGWMDIKNTDEGDLVLCLNKEEAKSLITHMAELFDINLKRGNV
jgi:hypothetical protein